MSTSSYSKLMVLLSCTCLAFAVSALPKFNVIKRLDINGITEVRLHNETRRELACYVAIDGQKRKFRLLPLTYSNWYKANSPDFKHTDFSIWCDHIEFHPQYKKYR